MTTASEVGNFCVGQGAKGKRENQDVVWFEVAVNDCVVMKERQAFSNLKDKRTTKRQSVNYGVHSTFQRRRIMWTMKSLL